MFIAEVTSNMTYEAFMADPLTRFAVERNFEIMGEAVNRLYRRSPDLTERISGSRQIVNFRNALAHGYDTIDYSKVGQIIHESLPVTRKEIESILREAERGDS